MREQAKIWLAFLREANNRGVMLDIATVNLLYDVLKITDQEIMEIGEVLKADIRERYSNSPHFALINAFLEGLPKL